MTVCVEPRGRAHNQRVGIGADGYYDAVELDLKLRALTGHRAPSARCVRLAEIHLNALYRPDSSFFVANHLNKVGEQFKDNALFLGVVNFLAARGHLTVAAAVDYIDLLRTEPFCAAGGIHRHVAPANDRHPAGLLYWRVIIIFVGFHQVYSGKELVC